MKKINIFNIFIFIAVVSFYIQIQGNKYGDNYIVPFLWLIINILPLLITFNIKKSKITNNNILNLSFNIYATSLLAILFLMPIGLIFFKSSGTESLIKSFFILLPLQAVLILATFYTKIKTEISEKNRIINSETKANFIQLISNNNISKLFKSLNKLYVNDQTKKNTDLIILEREYKEYKRKLISNTITTTEYEVAINRISSNLIELIKEL